MIPNATTDACENAPPEKASNKPNIPPDVCSRRPANCVGSIPGNTTCAAKR